MDKDLYRLFSFPEVSEWELWLNNHTRYQIYKGDEPNWFHRRMQEWLLGVKWKKREEET